MSIYKTPLYDVREIMDIRDMMRQSLEIYGDKAAYLVKDPHAARSEISAEDNSEKPYLPITFKQTGEDVRALGSYFYAGSYPRKRVALLGETRYEWYLSYLATVTGFGVVVPLDKELPDGELQSLLERSEADILIYSQSKKRSVDNIRPNLDGVTTFICMDPTEEDLYIWDLIEKGQAIRDSGDLSFDDAPIDREKMGILLFTSGTTAKSKAVMLSHKNICKNLMAMCSMLYIDEKDVFLSVLPIHHTYECTCGFLCQFYRGCTVAVCDGLRYIVQNLKESKASMILVVPLMLEMFYKRIIKGATSDPKLARKFNFGLKLTRFLRKFGIDLRRKIFAKIHDMFGGNIRMMIAGGAAIAPEVLAGMQDLGFNCVQGYGVTECAPILALNRDCYFKNESAGLPLPDVEIKIIDKDENGIGEICGRGDNVMLGYYENEAATKEAIDEDGFYHTGDLGRLDDDHFVIITGRKANMIVTKNGKNIFPEEIEFLISQNPLVAEVLVSGVSTGGDILVHAEIFPSREAIDEDPELKGEELTSDKVKAKLDAYIREMNHKLATYKYVRNISLHDTEFDKTTSRKIRRHKAE
jgi:long-chain acyl-CoA synthetase